MAIVPDTKDWTWVLDERCPECGFFAAEITTADVGRLLRENAAAWRPLLDHPLADRRPDDATWSAIEYACHVRDVFRLYDRRLGWMLTEDDPTFPNWDQDETAIAERYDEQAAGPVLDELEAAGAALADAFDAVPAEAWSRTGHRSDGADFTVDTFARYLVHDPIHHLWDVTTGYERAASGPGR